MRSPYTHGTVHQARLNTCRGCEFYDRRFMRCKVSGYLVPVVARVAYQSCPVKKW